MKKFNGARNKHNHHKNKKIHDSRNKIKELLEESEEKVEKADNSDIDETKFYDTDDLDKKMAELKATDDTISMKISDIEKASKESIKEDADIDIEQILPLTHLLRNKPVCVRNLQAVVQSGSLLASHRQ
jgi:hypothetical protein